MRFFRPPFVALVTALAFCGVLLLLAKRAYEAPPRETFALFPMRIADWKGRTERYSDKIIAALKVEDYLLANFSAGGGERDAVNLYVAYYKSQSLGSAAHSPRTCIPGDGWEIDSLTRVAVGVPHASLVVNRAVISKGRVRQLVYYWFDQRGRTLSSEYAVKWHLFADGLLKNRTDGALIRLIVLIHGNDVRGAEQRLENFLSEVYPRLRPYVPS